MDAPSLWWQKREQNLSRFAKSLVGTILSKGQNINRSLNAE